MMPHSVALHGQSRRAVQYWARELVDFVGSVGRSFC